MKNLSPAPTPQPPLGGFAPCCLFAALFDDLRFLRNAPILLKLNNYILKCWLYFQMIGLQEIPLYIFLYNFFFLLSKRIKDHFQNHFVGLCGSVPKFCTVITFKPLHFSALGLWLGSIVQLLQRNFLLRILFFLLLFLYPYLVKKIHI